MEKYFIVAYDAFGPMQFVKVKESQLKDFKKAKDEQKIYFIVPIPEFMDALSNLI